MAPITEDNPSANPNHPDSSESEYDVLDKNNSDAGSFMSTPAEAEMDSSDDKKLTISKVSAVEVPPSPDTENATQATNSPQSKPILDISDPEAIVRAAKLIATFANEIERLGGVKFLEDLEKIRNNQTPPKSTAPDSCESGPQQATEAKDVQPASTATDETVAKQDQNVNKTEEVIANDQLVEGKSSEKENTSHPPIKDGSTPAKPSKEPPSEEETGSKAGSGTLEEKKDQDAAQDAAATKETSTEDAKEDASAKTQDKKEGPSQDDTPKEETKADSPDGISNEVDGKEEPKDGEPKSETTNGQTKEPEVKDEAKKGDTKEDEVKEGTTEENKQEEAKEDAKDESKEETTEEAKPEEPKPEEVKQEPPPPPVPAPAPAPISDPPHDPFKGVRADPTETEGMSLDANGKPKPSPSRPGMPILPALGRRWVAKESDGVELLAPEKEWERRKKELGEKSAAIDQLMAMVGLEQVKSEFLAIKSTIDAAKNRKGMLRRQEFNLALIGNPGTGKKTLATIYRTLCKECAAWSSINSPHNEKRSGFDFQADKDIEGFHLVLNNYGENSKVFVFIDCIEGMSGSLRADLLYTLDRHAERLRLVVVIAGTETAMNKLLASRPSGRWQFPRRLTIKDYDDEQLRLIFLQMVRHNGFTIEGGETGPYPRIVAKRVARNRESGGFANAYDLVLAWEKILDRQAARLDQEHAAWKAAEDKRAEEWKAVLEKKCAKLKELFEEQARLLAHKKAMIEGLESKTRELEEKKQEQQDLKEGKSVSESSSKKTPISDSEGTEKAVEGVKVYGSKEFVQTNEAAKTEDDTDGGLKPAEADVELEKGCLKSAAEDARTADEDVKSVEECPKSGDEAVKPKEGDAKPAEEAVKPAEEVVKSEKEDAEKKDVQNGKENTNSEKEDAEVEEPGLSPEEVELAAKIEKLKKEIKEFEEMLSSLREYKACRSLEIYGRLLKLSKKYKPTLKSPNHEETSAASKPDEPGGPNKSTSSDSDGGAGEAQEVDQKPAEEETKPSVDGEDKQSTKGEQSIKVEVDEPAKDEKPAEEEAATNDETMTTVGVDTETKPTEEASKSDIDTPTDKSSAENKTETEDPKKADDKSSKAEVEAAVAAAAAAAAGEEDEEDLLSLLQSPAPKPNARFLNKEDIIGPEPEDIRPKSKAWQELEKMAGLEDVKKAICELLNRAKANYRREILGKEPLKTSLNQVFLGPPGTGKTTVAKLYGQILAEIGLLSTKEVVFKTPADFIGQYIGESEVKTAHILDSTIGKVLIVDDAHMFYHGGRPGTTHESDEFRLSCIDVMISKIHNKPGEDRCVLLLGYPDMMEEMFQKCNPGLRRRFPLEEAFRFKSYDDKALNEILRLKMEKEEITADEGAMEVAAEVLRRARDRPNFGNGGDVDNLLNQAKTRYRARIKVEADKEAEAEAKQTEEKPVELPNVTKVEDDESAPGEQQAQIQVDLPTAVKAKAAESPKDTPQPEKEDSLESPPPTETTPPPPTDKADILTNSESRIVLVREDFDPDWNRGALASSKCNSLFSELIGFEPIISKFEGYQRLAANMRRRGKDPREIVPFTFIFKGPPGTGKTHTARIMGQIFYDMGFLSTNEVIECSASNLIGQYMGQTSPKVINLFEKALGKVLFIDEAYRLSGGNRGTGHGSYEEEAIGELVDCMTKPRYLRKMIIVLAGYDKDMDNLMQVNAGLRGRFATEIVFPAMTASKAKQHLKNLLLKEDIELRDDVDPGEEEKEKVLRYLHQLGKTVGWANARDVKSLAATVTGQVYRDVDLDEFEREEEEQEGVEDGQGEGSDNKKKKKLLRVSTKQLNAHLKEMFRQRMRSGGLA
ncbi:hypothetical protein QBC40DRAFT_223947 [Triangularia verruculosa]|uniref:AAA+ ATPase domain-containing protein n=1 Tax=Triangularia verruculosa TaxID=2587418 RepID=A0AAN6XKM0_9PEZI|nr:hypothetical protein QBC40DRAFT_223947 [Triangularia verruculosa]